MVRSPCFDNNGIKKGAWSRDEDNKLRAYIEKYGHSNWRELPKLAGLARCGKSCRLRWMNYLRPNLKLGNFTKEEENVIIDLHNKLGNKWSKIAARLPGRSDNEIKNHWHTHLKNRTRNNKPTLKNDQSARLEPCYSINPKACPLNFHNSTAQQEVEILVAVLSSSSSTCESSSSSSLGVSDSTVNPRDVTSQISDSTAGNIWIDQSFLLDDGEFMLSSDNMFSPLALADDLISQTSLDYMMEDIRLWST